jgi:hypothetical protein
MMSLCLLKHFPYIQINIVSYQTTRGYTITQTNKKLSAIMCHINKLVLFLLKIVLLQLIVSLCCSHPSSHSLHEDDIEESIIIQSSIWIDE